MPYQYSFATLARANERLHEVSLLVTTYHSGMSYGYVDATDANSGVVETRFVINNPPSIEISVALAETINMYRIALDSVIFAVVRQKNVDMNEKVASACSFPIFQSEQLFNKFIEDERRAQWPAELKEILGQLQPFELSEHEAPIVRRCYSLLELQRLSNVSKHRHALSVTPWPADVVIYSSDGSGIESFEFLSARPRTDDLVWKRKSINPDTSFVVPRTALVIVDDQIFPDAKITDTPNECIQVLRRIAQDCHYIVTEISRCNWLA